MNEGGASKSGRRLTADEKSMLREEFSKAWPGDDKMVEHCVKSTTGYFVADDGIIVTFDKPRIETEFWFGERNYEDRSAEVRAASRDVDYFIRRNMKQIDRLSLDPRDGYESGSAYVYDRRYCSQPDDCRLGYASFVRFGEEQRNRGVHGRRLTAPELDRYREAVENQRVLFMRRLKTYLKRYGLGKCTYDTFWADR